MNFTLVFVMILYIIMMVRGYKKGLVKMVTSVACSLFSLLIARLFTPAATEALMKNPDVTGWVSEKVIPLLKGVTTAMVVSALVYVCLFIIALALSKGVAAVMKKAASLPVVSFANQILGGAIGATEATIYVWIFMLIVTMLPQFEICGTILRQIDASQFLSILYQNDPLFTLVKSISLNFPA